MSKAVFIASSHSAYDDRPGEVYHFPNMYLGSVAKTVGDWVILYQGRRGGVSGYYAVQRVEKIVPDPGDPTHSYAVFDRASLLTFERAVPRWRADDTPYEIGLPRMGGNNTYSVRPISEATFAAIVDEGLREEITADTLPREGPLPQPQPSGFAEAQAGFVPLDSADRMQILTSRAFRDRAFRVRSKLPMGRGAQCRV